MRAYAQMLPRLEAEEALRMVTVAGVPWMEQSDQRDMLRELRRAARVETKPQFVSPGDVARSMGIKVQRG